MGHDIPKIILDCDPAGYILTGLDVDDDLAILNAISLHQKGVIELLGITITGGNAPVAYTYPDALELVRRRAGISDSILGIYRGNVPLIKTRFEHSGRFEGIDPSVVESSDASTYIIETILNWPSNSITILCIGPLTNLASAFLMEPQIAKRVGKVVTMGGTLTRGLPYDLNIRTDPVAAAIVWNNMDCPKIALPVETCIQAVFGPTQLREVQEECVVASSSTDHATTSPIICSLLLRMRIQLRVMPWTVNSRFSTVPKQNKSQWIDKGFVLWDLVALWAAVQPELFDVWTSYDVTVLPTGGSGFVGAYGPSILWDDSSRWDMPPTGRAEVNATILRSQNNRCRISVPLKLRDEVVLHNLVMQNLYLPQHVLAKNNQSGLKFREQLGSLPEAIATMVLLLIGTFALRKAWNRRRR